MSVSDNPSLLRQGKRSSTPQNEAIRILQQYAVLTDLSHVVGRRPVVDVADFFPRHHVPIRAPLRSHIFPQFSLEMPALVLCQGGLD